LKTGSLINFGHIELICFGSNWNSSSTLQSMISGHTDSYRYDKEAEEEKEEESLVIKTPLFRSLK